MPVPVIVDSFESLPPEEWLRVALTSDLHFGERLSDRHLCKFLAKINSLQPDLYLNLGDNSHGWNGFDKTEKVLRFERETLSPDIVRAGVTGNHDFWLRSDQLPYELRKRKLYRGDRPPEGFWSREVDRVGDIYKDGLCHNFDLDGPLRIKGHTFFGYMGWYGEDGKFIHEKTNDYSNMPWHIQGVPIHAFFQQRAERTLDKNLQLLTEEDHELVFCSHFPVVEIDPDESGRHYCGSPAHGRILAEHFGVTCFLNGHEHRRLTGPQRFSAGSDYGKPKYLLLAFPLST